MKRVVGWLAVGSWLGALPAGAMTFTAADVEIVTDPRAGGVVQYAAKEMRTHLEQTLGGEVRVVHKFTPGKKAIVLGTNAWSAAAGIHPETLARDGFIIKTAGDRVYVAGCDDPRADMEGHVTGTATDGLGHDYERATYFGTLEFLERFAGVRFYFPGELGTVVQPRATLTIPETDRAFEPEFEVRTYSDSRPSIGAWYEPITEEDFATQRILYRYRLRKSTETLICCHGQIGAHIAKRFGAAHPEWLLMKKDGTRISTDVPKGKSQNSIQLCPSSDVWNEIYEDAKAYFTGQSAASRKIPSRRGGLADYWPTHLAGRDRHGLWYDVMPNDGMGRCYCEQCKTLLGATNDFDFATEIVWKKTAEVANRLKKEGIPGRLTQMAYRPYRRVPKTVEIPDNVDVMVSESGPWSVVSPWKLKRDNDEIKSWFDKLGRKVWLWNYANKHAKRAIPGLPALAPRSYAAYYKSVMEWARGAYCESETDRMSYNWLNFYVYSKVSWDRNIDVEAILKEHHQLLFGAAAPEMTQIFDVLERKWTHDMVGTYVDTPLGPSLSVPKLEVIHEKIYSKQFVAELDALFAAALKKVAPGSLEARRVELFKHEFRDGIARFAGIEVVEKPRPQYEDRWVHMRLDLTTDAQLARFEKIAQRAADSGFNGLLFDGAAGGDGFDFHNWKGARLARLEKAKACAKKLNLEIVPLIWSTGRAHAILDYDASLAEGIPVKDVPYVCTGKEAVFAAADEVITTNLFEDVNVLEATGKRRVDKTFNVKPYRRYAVKLKASTADFKISGGTGVKVYTVRSSVGFNLSGIGADPGRLGSVSLPNRNKENQAVYFECMTRNNTAANFSASLYYRADSGRATVGPVEVRGIGIRHPVVRAGAPFVVKDAETGVIYTAGKDYIAPKSNASVPNARDRDMALKIPAGSAIRAGTKLLVSAYEAARVSAHQVGACMANPALFDYFEKSAPAIDALFDHPKKWFLSMDEIRAGGTCELCAASGKTRAQALVECLTHQRDAIRKVCPDALIYAWSDMYDPYVNANPKRRNQNYAMCKGGYGFDKLEVPKDIIAVVWGGEETAEKSLRYFTDQGYATLYAGFYDVFNPRHFRVRGVVPLINRIPNCRGAIYTTWTGGKYDLVPTFGKNLEVSSKPLRPAK